MNQVVQNLRSGATELMDVPCPTPGPGQVLVQTRRSLISAGTERMLVEFSQGNLLQKARSQPDKVRQVLDKIRTDGVLPTLETVFRRLDEPLPLGYCNAGVVIEVGRKVSRFKPGDRVATNGSHAEIVCVPEHLCAAIPDGVSEEEASSTPLAAIALQGMRLLAPEFGERIVVFGAGLIGLLAVQLLRANGCQVMAIDVNDERLAFAGDYGAATCNAADDPVAAVSVWTDGRGADGVLIAASTKSDDLVHQSAEMCRKRGRIVLVGVVGLGLRRSDLYEKEISFQVSCSYGPGRYDNTYEQEGQDYPYGFVRWTEQRNFEAVLAAMADRRLKISELITNRISIEEAESAYALITDQPATLGVSLVYPDASSQARTLAVAPTSDSLASPCSAALVGAGNFAKMVLAPALASSSARRKYVVARTNSASASHIASKYAFEQASTDFDDVLADPDVNTVFIASGHDSHATLVRRALDAGKHTFVEKPLAVDIDQLRQIADAYAACGATGSPIQLLVGFNRRFAPLLIKARELLARRTEPLAIHYAANAGVIPPDAWVHAQKHGGRIIGEACHFIDVLRFLTGSPIETVSASRMGTGVAVQDDKMCISMTFADGSIGTVNYFGNGNPGFPKETLHVYSEGRILELSNYRRLQGWGFSGFNKLRTRADKGHNAEVAAFVERVGTGGEPLIPFDELVNVTLASFAAMDSSKRNAVITLADAYPEFPTA